MVLRPAERRVHRGHAATCEDIEVDEEGGTNGCTVCIQLWTPTLMLMNPVELFQDVAYSFLSKNTYCCICDTPNCQLFKGDRESKKFLPLLG